MLDTTRPFLRADAVSAGISPSKLVGRRYRRLFRAVYIDADVVPTHQERLEAALLIHPDGAWLSHTSAAALYGIAVPEDAAVHVSVRRARDRRWQPDLKPHVAPADSATSLVGGLPVSGSTRLFIELASMLGLVDLVAAGDSLLRRQRMAKVDLCRALDTSRDYWSGAARRAAPYLREGVDSAMESRSRMLMSLGGLPEPRVNHLVRDEKGDVVYRFDLAFPAVKVAVEYDGRHHAHTWHRDLQRREHLERMGWRIITLVSSDLFVSPEPALRRIAEVLQERGHVVPPLSDAWRTHFPERRIVA